MQKAARTGTILISDTLITELLEVLARPKFARVVDREDVRAFVQALGGIAERVELTLSVQACRDPNDDHLLALALSGGANVIVTGDEDLLVLSPFRDISIVTPAAFLELGDY